MNRLFLVILLLLPCAASAQVRLSIDEKSVQVSDGKRMTSERSLYLHPDGKLVSVQYKPSYLISLSNNLGEMRSYNPKTNEVMVINDKGMASEQEMVVMFASGRYVDMSLPQQGYRQSAIRNEDGMIIKTFVPTNNTVAIAKVELVLQNQLPICMLYYNTKNECIRKVYYSQYEYGRIPMPMRITEIDYPSKTDSIVRLSTYTNLLIGNDAKSEMFDWQIPSDAKRSDLDLNQLMQK